MRDTYSSAEYQWKRHSMKNMRRGFQMDLILPTHFRWAEKRRVRFEQFLMQHRNSMGAVWMIVLSEVRQSKIRYQQSLRDFDFWLVSRGCGQGTPNGESVSPHHYYSEDRLGSSTNLSSIPSLVRLDAEYQVLVKQCQEEAFQQDLDQLKKKQQLRTSSGFLSLKPIMDNTGLLRVGGRLNNA